MAEAMTKLLLVLVVLKISLKSNDVHSQSSMDLCTGPPVCPPASPGAELPEEICPLLQQCCVPSSIGISSADILRTDVSLTAMCPLSGENFVWSLDNVAANIQQDIQIDGGRYSNQSQSLVIQNVTGEHEGIYRCRVTGSSDTPALCLIALGRGRFKTCPENTYVQEPSEEAGGEGSCLLTEQIAVEIGSSALLDVALLFENGGECRNQIVRTLTLSRVAMPGLPPPPSLFVCSNIPGTEFMGLCCDDNRMINTESKFSVIYDTTCERECKYRISLRLNNFNYIDVGLYEAVVSMDEGRIGARRVIKKYFNLTATAPVTSTKNPLDLTSTTSITDETTSGSTEEDDEPISGSNNTIVYVMAAVIALLIAILVLLLIIYLVRRKTRKQTATRQSGEGGGTKLQPSAAEETSTGSQEHVYEPMDKELLKKIKVDVTSPNKA